MREPMPSYRDPVGMAAKLAGAIILLAGLVVLVHPILSSRFYHTVDGPAHLYTAGLLRELLTSAADPERPWANNPLPVPNMLGHGLLALLLLFLEPPEALKFVHLTILTGIPLLTWTVQRQRGWNTTWGSALVLPFVVNSPFLMGYLNFCLGLLLLLAVVLQSGRAQAQPRSPARWTVLALLLLFLYASHLLPFLFGVLWLALQAFPNRIRGGTAAPLPLLPLLVSLLPAMTLTAIYLRWTGLGNQLPWHTVSRAEEFVRPFVLVDYFPELLLWAFALGLLAATWLFTAPAPGHDRRDMAAVLFLLGCALHLVLGPDALGSGTGALSRVSVIGHVTAVAIIPVIAQRTWKGLLLGASAVVIVTGQTTIRHPALEARTEDQRRVYNAINALQPARTAAVVAFDWSRTNEPYLGYAGTRTLVRSNYELLHTHFPLRWTADEHARIAMLPADTLDALSGLSNMRGADLRRADHVIVVGDPVNEQLVLFALLLEELRDSHVPHASDHGLWTFERRRRTDAPHAGHPPSPHADGIIHGIPHYATDPHGIH